MIGYRQTLLVFLLMMLSGATIAQNNTNSPYTRYGYGQLADQGSRLQRLSRLEARSLLRFRCSIVPVSEELIGCG